jgi:hypothetical protein
MLTTILRTSFALLTFTALSLVATGCDSEVTDEDTLTFRGGGGIGGITFNTSNWVSAGARDVYEFDRTGMWRTNTYGFEVRLKKLTFDSPSYGEITTNPSNTPASGMPWVEITGANELTLELHDLVGGTTSYTGADLVGLELLLDVKSAGSNSYNVKLQIVKHAVGPRGGDFYEFDKIDPIDNEVIGAICETSSQGDRKARVYNNTSVHALTGEIVPQSNVVHIGCTASAPGKSSLYGYFPRDGSQTFRLINRVIRADYCADGHPYTYPGNSLLIRDNFSPGQEGQTLADVASYAIENDAVLEAVWDIYGIVCIETPRVDNLKPGDVICPVKPMPDGTTSYNWKPPRCSDMVGSGGQGLRVYSLTANDSL